MLLLFRAWTQVAILNRVRIFDRILWLVGEPRYSCSEDAGASAGTS
jgi:hypothetical protein